MRALAADLKPVVLIPGCGGSELHSVRGVVTRLYLDPRLILDGHCSYLKMNPRGSADANPRIQTAALRCMPRAYDKLRLFLNKNAWLHEFPYDWRRRVEYNARRLHRAIEGWADRTAERKFTVVCHSMGGLVARAYLALYPKVAEERIERVIMLGTPHYGVISILLTLIRGDTGLKIMEKINAANAPLEMMRSMPSMFQIMPAPRELFQAPVAYPVDGDWDLYRAKSWRIEGIRQRHLNAGARFHALLAGPAAQVPLIEIAGCNHKTAVALKRTTGPSGEPDYDVHYEDEGPNAGDDTVPLWSTLPPGGTRYVVEAKHGELPHNKEVLCALLRLINGDANVGLQHQLPSKSRWRGTVRSEPVPRRTRETALEDPDEVAEREASRLRKRLEDNTFDLQDLNLLRFGL
jgi:pimeloyl-ACP methyl ester carboxylesterase